MYFTYFYRWIRSSYYFIQKDLMEFLSLICNSLEFVSELYTSCVGVECWFGNEKIQGVLRRKATIVYGFTRGVWEIVLESFFKS